MPIFAYTAVNGSGTQSQGSLSAQNRHAALDEILSRGLHPVDVKETGNGARVNSHAEGRDRVRGSQVDAFTRELSNLLAAGVPLSRALKLLSENASHSAARAQWASIHEDVIGGESLANALAKFPRSFSEVYVAMVRAGETGGFLDLVLEQIADFQDREKDLKGKIQSALVYPCALVFLAACVLVFLLTYFIPRFTAIFRDFGGTLPWLTRMIVLASEMVLHYGLFIFCGLAVIGLCVKQALYTDAGRRLLERFVLAIPGLGLVTARFALVRFCRTLGTLIDSGVPLLAALKVAKESIGNQTLADTVDQTVENVQQGGGLATSLSASVQLFPPSVIEMILVAEESGRLDKELVRLANSFEKELDRRLRILLALMEPALLFCMAALVGTLVVGMLLPIFQLQELIH